MVFLGRAQKRQELNSPGPLDITIKSSTGWAKAFAPTWDMVLAHKKGTMSDEEYTLQYARILDNIPASTWETLHAYGLRMGGHITFICYCPDGAFCHTNLLIDYMTHVRPYGVYRRR